MVSGALYTDAFFGAQPPFLLPLMCATAESGKFPVMEDDGVLGLALGTSNGSFLSALFTSGALDRRAFTLCLAPPGAPGALLLGAARAGGAGFAWARLPASRFRGYFPTVVDLLVGGASVCSTIPCGGLNAPYAILDSSSPASYVPASAIDSTLASVAAWCAASAERCVGTPVSVPLESLCYQTAHPASFPNFSFVLEGDSPGDPSVNLTFPLFVSIPVVDLPSVHCVYVYNGGSGGTVIGARAFANVTLAFDLEGGRLGVGADTSICAAAASASAGPAAESASASASGALSPSASASGRAPPSAGASGAPSPSAGASGGAPPSTAARSASGSAAPSLAPPAARSGGGLAPGAVAAIAGLGAAAAGGAALLLRRRALQRGGKGGQRGAAGAQGGDGEARPNPASAASRRTLTGDVLSVWGTAAEGGAGTAAAAARAEALRELLLLRGDAPLPPRPSEGEF
jgi:hypothetical protein